MKIESLSGFPLAGALSVVLPDSETTLLLKACLHSDKAGRSAWQAWPRGRNRLSDEKGAVQSLRGLILSAIQRNGLTVDCDSLTYLRTAYVKEQLRLKIYNRLLREVLSGLSGTGIPVIILKGAALAETVYDEPVLRHCHDIDLLVRDQDIIRAKTLLPRLGFKTANPPDSKLHHWRFEHESGLPVELHSRLFKVPYYDPPLPEMWARTQRHAIAGVPAHILSPSDNILHICGHASYSSSRHSLRWVSDAWFILDRHRDLDWDLLLDCARRSHLALPLSVMLGYLAEHLHAPIPETFLDRLYAAASHTDTAGREAALWGTLASTGGDLTKLIWATPKWRARVYVIKWLLIPSPHYLRWAEQMRHAWLLPLHYFYRPIKYIKRRAWFRCQNFIQRKALRRDPVTP